MTEFADNVLQWFDQHGRKDLPWQKDPTPYRVWISEIMLQQTQVTTVIPYYRRFMQSFPDVVTLADAGIDDVLHHWSGLGYYARARNLHKAATAICDTWGGEFPAGFDDVIALPGIGRSTAGAILALSRGERHAILDGNVKRVLARFHTVGGWPAKTSVANTLWHYAESHTPAERVREYTQAMMDIGATVCTRSRPRCDACPLALCCAAKQSGAQAQFPGKKPKNAKPQRSTRMLLVRHGDTVWLERRPEAGIWGGLWSLPELEADDAVHDWCEATFNAGPESIEEWGVLRHSFTHYDLDIHPVAVTMAGLSSESAVPESTWYDVKAPPAIGLAAPVRTLLELVLERQVGEQPVLDPLQR